MEELYVIESVGNKLVSYRTFSLPEEKENAFSLFKELVVKNKKLNNEDIPDNYLSSIDEGDESDEIFYEYYGPNGYSCVLTQHGWDLDHNDHNDYSNMSFADKIKSLFGIDITLILIIIFVVLCLLLLRCDITTDTNSFTAHLRI